MRIFAASSLTAAMQAAKPKYEASHKDSTLILNLGASNALRVQIEPIGDYTDQALSRMDVGGTFGPAFRAHVFANVHSFQHTEQEVMAKVLLGEADAGIGRTQTIPIAIFTAMQSDMGVASPA